MMERCNAVRVSDHGMNQNELILAVHKRSYLKVLSVRFFEVEARPTLNDHKKLTVASSKIVYNVI